MDTKHSLVCPKLSASTTMFVHAAMYMTTNTYVLSALINQKSISFNSFSW